MMSLQDVPVRNSATKARTMFDNGSKLTLISSFFAKKNNLSYEEASYTISGVGGATTIYNYGDKNSALYFYELKIYFCTSQDVADQPSGRYIKLV